MSTTLPETHLEIANKNPQRTWLIGDLDGSFANFIRHMNELRMLSEKWEWIWWNTRLIFSGDILADRWDNGFEILLKIHELRIAAEKAGWSIDILAWNHEWFMLLYFRGADIQAFSSENLPKISPRSEHYGMTELLQYWSNRDEIIKNMRTDPQWRTVLEEICKMKLMTYTEDALHFHTPPSNNMLNIMMGFYKNMDCDLRKGIHRINTLWEASLRSILLGEKFPHTNWGKTAKDVYDLFHNSFLHTYNGSIEMIASRTKNWFNEKKHWGNVVPKEHPMYKIIYVSWFKVIYYGHDNNDLEIPWIATKSMNRASQWLKKEWEGTPLIIKWVLENFIDIVLP